MFGRAYSRANDLNSFLKKTDPSIRNFVRSLTQGGDMPFLCCVCAKNDNGIRPIRHRRRCRRNQYRRVSPRNGFIYVSGIGPHTSAQAVLLQAHNVLAWHKVPTTADIQTGVGQSIQEVIRKGAISPASISSVHIGTTVSCHLFRRTLRLFLCIKS